MRNSRELCRERIWWGGWRTGRRQSSRGISSGRQHFFYNFKIKFDLLNKITPWQVTAGTVQDQIPAQAVAGNCPPRTSLSHLRAATRVDRPRDQSQGQIGLCPISLLGSVGYWPRALAGWKGAGECCRQPWCYWKVMALSIHRPEL